jgi:hypothetical protein
MHRLHRLTLGIAGLVLILWVSLSWGGPPNNDVSAAHVPVVDDVPPPFVLRASQGDHSSPGKIEVQFAHPHLFALPASIPVTEGDADAGLLWLGFVPRDQHRTVVCHYHGTGSSHGHAGGGGVAYQFQSCANGLRAGDSFSPRVVFLHIGPRKGKTSVELVLDDSPPPPPAPPPQPIPGVTNGGAVLAAHGPLFLDGATLARLPAPPPLLRPDIGGPIGGGGEEDDGLGSAPGAPSAPSPASFGEDDPSEQTPALLVTAEATGNLAASGGFTADAQIAASRTHLAVSGRAVLAFYQRRRCATAACASTVDIDAAGAQETAPEQVKVVSVGDFFSPLGFDSPTSVGVNGYFDARIIFDGFRNRFWITALLRTNSATIPTIVVTAVSLTQDHMDGFYLYWWPGIVGEIFAAGDSGDYPTIGVSQDVFTEAHVVSGTADRFTQVDLWSADDLANAAAPHGWRYWDLVSPGGSPLTNILQPAMHHTGGARTFWASRVDTDKVVVWSFSGLSTPQQTVQATAVTVAPFMNPVDAPQKDAPASCGMDRKQACDIRMTNLGTELLKAVVRAGRLYVTANDARDWFNDGQTLSTNRIIRLDVSGFPSVPASGPAFIDRPFGANNVFDDPPDAHIHYGWSAVEVNKDGDMAIAYARTGTIIFPEARVSAFLASETDIRPSRLLKAGEAPFLLGYPNVLAASTSLAWGDTAGATVDPRDDVGIWVAQLYATAMGTTPNGNYSIWLGRIFGDA